jgi:hypothetical protein
LAPALDKDGSSGFDSQATDCVDVFGDATRNQRCRIRRLGVDHSVIATRVQQHPAQAHQ